MASTLLMRIKKADELRAQCNVGNTGVACLLEKRIEDGTLHTSSCSLRL